MERVTSLWILCSKRLASFSRIIETLIESDMYTTGMVSNTTTTDRTRKIAITLPKSVLQKIDNERGDVPRSRYILRAVESYLHVKKGSRSKSEH